MAIQLATRGASGNVYMCSLWVNYRKMTFHQFIVAYDNSYRILNRLPMRCTASDMFATDNVNSCTCVIRTSIHKCFSKMFKLKSRMHSHETRQKNYIHIAGTRTTSAKQCIRQYIPTVLTSIPTLVSDKITTHSYAGFSKYAKQYFIQLYKYECVISNCYICSNAT